MYSFRRFASLPHSTNKLPFMPRIFQLGCRRGFSTSSPCLSVPNSLLGLPPETQEMHLVARDFADNEMFPHAEKWDRECLFPVDTLRQLGELGFAGIYTREEHGGSGLSRLDAASIFEALATACPSTTAYLSIHNMCAWVIDEFGSSDLRAKHISKLMTMEHFSSYCLTEPGSGSDAASLKTTAVRDGDDLVLNGSKVFISGGGFSDVYLVMCRTGTDGPGGISCVLVEKGTEGLEYGKKAEKLGWNCQPTAELYFENCRVPATNLIGKEGDGFKIAMKALDGGRINIGACSLGAAQKCIELARDHIHERHQFGKPLSANQHVQFKFADMCTDLEAARNMIRTAASLLDQNHADKTAYCAMAKRFSTDVGFNVCNDALQLFGGYGYLKEYPIERYLRDVRVHQILEGTNEVMRMVVSRAALSK